MIEHKLREIDKVQINGIDWKVFVDDVPDIITKEAYWGANTYHRWIIVYNVIDDGLPFSKYLIWRCVEEAKIQYTRN